MYAKLYYLVSCGLNAILKEKKNEKYLKSGTDNMTNKQQRERDLSNPNSKTTSPLTSGNYW
jgi:hypothetical protein